MTITVEAYTGSETVGTTEHSMTTDTSGPDTDTTDGVFQASIDLSALAAGDEFEFKIYEKARGADTQRLVLSATFAGAQSYPIAKSLPLVLGNGWDMTLKKISGTDRAITWSIAQLA